MKLKIIIKLTTSLWLLILAPSAFGASCDLQESKGRTKSFDFMNYNAADADWDEALCASRSIRAAAAMMLEASRAQELGDTNTMCSKAYAAILTMEPYEKGRWRETFPKSAEHFDNDFEGIFAQFRKLPCPQKITYYTKRAEAGESWAMNNLGYAYQKGSGTTVNAEKAIYWLEKSAALNYTRAMNNLAHLYADGEVVPKDDAKAFAWHLKSAEAGDVAGQYYVAEFYQQGRGTDQDFDKAAEWYKKSAKQGDEDAKKRLKEMKKSGQLKKTFGLF